jgi:hypothetical protein
MERPGADFGPLIAALTQASANPEASLAEQLASLELSLVSAELNPNVIEAVELFYSLNALKEINLEARSSARGTADLTPWFEEN